MVWLQIFYLWMLRLIKFDLRSDNAIQINIYNEIWLRKLFKRIKQLYKHNISVCASLRFDYINRCANNKYIERVYAREREREREKERANRCFLLLSSFVLISCARYIQQENKSFKLSMFSNMSYRVTFRFTSLPYCV